MRILVLSDLYPPVAFGGYELECAALTDRLRERHDVTVLTTRLDRRRTPADPGVLRELPFMGGRLRPALQAPGAAVLAARITRRVLREHRPDLVYVSNGAALPQAAIQVAATAGIPVVCRFSELWFTRSFLVGDRFLRDLARTQGAGPRALWACGQRLTNRAPALRLDPAPRFAASISWASAALRDVAGVPAAIDLVDERVIRPATPRFAVFEAAVHAPAVPPYVAYIGRLTEAKGALVAVEALAALRAAGSDVGLEMAGQVSDSIRRRLVARAREAGVPLTLHGPLAPEDIAAVMAGATAVLVPSVVFEAFPLVMLEAALARAPVVASDLGGIGEGLANEEHALLVTPGDPGAAAAALHRVIADRAEAEARSQRAYARAQTFSLDAYLDASEDLIEHAL